MAAVSESDFERIVEDVAAMIGRVVSTRVVGFAVTVTYRSAANKQRWDASYEFDPETGRCVSAYVPYSGGGIAFRREVTERLMRTIRS